MFILYVTFVLDKFVILNYFLVQSPEKVGAKYSLPSFSRFSSGSVQTPMRFSLEFDPGRSFNEIEIDDL